jgi:arginase
MIDIIGVPFDLAGAKRGSALGPMVLRHTRFAQQLENLGYDITDCGDVTPGGEGSQLDGLNHFAGTLETLKGTKAAVSESLRRGALPLVLGGDHSISIGSVSAALEHYGDSLGLLWLDAHADVHTANTSSSRNIHGMSVGALLRMAAPGDTTKNAEWRRLLEEVVPQNGLKADRTGYIGLRDLDPAEMQAVAQLSTSTFVATMQDIDSDGMEATFDRLRRWMAGKPIQHLWVSFDIDVLDPVWAPGTGTPAPGGLTYREGHFVAERLHEMFSSNANNYQLAGVDIVETNTMLDEHNASAKLSTEWTASLFGKRILGPVPLPKELLIAPQAESHSDRVPR